MTQFEDFTTKELLQARERFASLILSRAAEREFQLLFTECPYILSRSLPLKVDPREIVPLGRPGVSEPDFAFYPKLRTPFYSFGAIELKCPDSIIITVPRKEIITLSRDAATAIAQLQVFASTQPSWIYERPEQYLFLGSPHYLFVIMGLSEELTKKLVSETQRSRVSNLLPSGVEILPYDVLLQRFAATIPSRFITLVPVVNDDVSESQAPEAFKPHTLGRRFMKDGKYVLVRGGDHSGIPQHIDPENYARISHLISIGYVFREQ